MNRLKRKHGLPGEIAICIVLAVIGISCLYPFWYTLIYAFSDSKATIAQRPLFLPIEFSTEAIYRVIHTQEFLNSYLNQIFIMVVGTILAVALSVSLAYPLSIKRLRGRGIVSMMMFFTMLFSGGMIPTYLLIRSLGLIDSLWALILSGMGSAFNIFILRTFFANIPNEIEESASIDGASQFRILLQIILPLSGAALAVQAMFYGMSYWNTFFAGILYINDSKKQILQVYLQSLMNSSAFGGTSTAAAASITSSSGVMTENTMKMAAVACSVIPVLIVYPFLQKYYVKGVIVGSVKG